MVFKLFRAYFEYRGYAYRFDREFFLIMRGYLSRQEIGVVYHQIQTVILRHALMDRMVGVSNLIIVMNGANEYRPAEVVLPALEKKKARLVQQEILRRARIRALEQGTSVNALLRDYLIHYAGARSVQEQAAARFLELAARSKARSGRRWTRDELHDR